MYGNVNTSVPSAYVGDPVSLFHHLGLGFWSFLANPAAGLVESAQGKGPQRIAVGFVEGLRGLAANIVYAFSNATVKASSSARKVSAIFPHISSGSIA